MFIYNFEAFAIQKIIVSNERGNSLSILSPEGKIIKEIKTCGRPRGLHFYQKQTKFLVACADDDLILIYNTNSLEVINRITNVASPETFDLNPDGETLMISNEEDSTASEWNLVTGEFINEYEIGKEPEGVLVTKDGKLAFVASEVADVRYFISNNEYIGYPVLIRLKINAAITPPEAAILVFRNTWLTFIAAASLLIISSEPPLNPNQPNQRIHTPKAAIGIFDPGMGTDKPLAVYLPFLGPRTRTTAKAAAAPHR